jgi:hypothetical protein
VSRLLDRIRDPETAEHHVASVLAWFGKAAAAVIEFLGSWT